MDTQRIANAIRSSNKSGDTATLEAFTKACLRVDSSQRTHDSTIDEKAEFRMIIAAQKPNLVAQHLTDYYDAGVERLELCEEHDAESLTKLLKNYSSASPEVQQQTRSVIMAHVLAGAGERQKTKSDPDLESDQIIQGRVDRFVKDGLKNPAKTAATLVRFSTRLEEMLDACEAAAEKLTEQEQTQEKEARTWTNSLGDRDGYSRAQ